MTRNSTKILNNLFSTFRRVLISPSTIPFLSFATVHMSSSTLPPKINSSRFYIEWKGHQIRDLTTFRDITTTVRPNKPIVYFAGDSSLDNKAWVQGTGPGGEPLPIAIPEIYNQTIDHPRPKPDVALWLNHFLGDRATCINTAVEESLLRERDDDLLSHDEFIRDNIRSEDVLIVSVGANDIALRPTKQTMWAMAQLAWFTRRCSIEDGSASSLDYFRDLFGTKIQDYTSRLVSKTKPRAVIVCMIYYPLESGLGQTSWADVQLKALGYNQWPGQLQAAIKQMYESATKKIKVEGTEVVPCPLFEVLDGKRVEEYTARVEPNSEGGRKMAERFDQMLKDIGV